MPEMERGEIDKIMNYLENNRKSPVRDFEIFSVLLLKPFENIQEVQLYAYRIIFSSML